MRSFSFWWKYFPNFLLCLSPLSAYLYAFVSLVLRLNFEVYDIWWVRESEKNSRIEINFEALELDYLKYKIKLFLRRMAVNLKYMLWMLFITSSRHFHGVVSHVILLRRFLNVTINFYAKLSAEVICYGISALLCHTASASYQKYFFQKNGKNKKRFRTGKFPALRFCQHPEFK